MNTGGFTIPELIVAVVVILVAALVAAALLYPANFSDKEKQASRTLALATLSQGLQRYRAKNGQWPAGIPATDTAIGSDSGKYNLCSSLVPTFLPDIPSDPDAGYKLQGITTTTATAPCNQKDITYFSGYDIALHQDGSILLTANADKSHVLTLVVRPN